MAAWAAVAIAVVGLVSSQENARRSASRADDLAAQAAQRQVEEERIAKEQKDLDIELATERFEFEKGSSETRRDVTTGLVTERDAAVRNAAIAGFSASGVDPFEKDTSALAVLNRIAEQSEREKGLVEEASKEFIASRSIELEQLKTSRAFTFNTFLSSSRRETQFEVSNREAEASAFRQQRGVGALSGGLGVFQKFAETDYGKTTLKIQ